MRYFLVSFFSLAVHIVFAQNPDPYKILGLGEKLVEYTGFNKDNLYAKRPVYNTPLKNISTTELSYTQTAITEIVECGDENTQARPSYLDQSAKLMGIGKTFDKTKKYPLIVWIPWTGGLAQTAFNMGKTAVGIDNYFAVLPQGKILTEDYLPDFNCYVQRYEQRLMADLKEIIKQYPIDTTKIYLTGFSVGGDLSWALMVRQKEFFAGAFIQGARCSYAITDEDLEYLKEQNKKIVMLLGHREKEIRHEGMTAAAKKLLNVGANVRHWIYPDYSATGHYMAERKNAEKAFKTLFSNSAPPAPKYRLTATFTNNEITYYENGKPTTIAVTWDLPDGEEANVEPNQSIVVYGEFKNDISGTNPKPFFEVKRIEYATTLYEGTFTTDKYNCAISGTAEGTLTLKKQKMHT